MKWQCCFASMVPAGLLCVFPELSLVRCERPHLMQMDEEINICRVCSAEPAREPW